MDKYDFEKKVFELVQVLENSAFSRGHLIQAHATSGHPAEFPSECVQEEDCYYRRRYSEELQRDLDASVGLRKLVSQFISEVE